MTTNIRVVRKIIVNGVEYHSLEAMPPDVRAKYEKAMDGALHSGVTLNGRPFDSVESLPPEVRKTIGDAVEPVLQSRRLVTTLLVIIAILAGVIAFLLSAR